MMQRAILIGFALWVLNGSSPPYKRDTFATYADCVVAGQAQIDSLKSLSPDITWQCAPDDGDQRREKGEQQ